MNDEKSVFLNLLKTTPARVTAEEAGWILGFAAHDIPALVKAGLLKPLGHPSPNCIKYFAAAELEKLRYDTHWLSRASDATIRYWQSQNARKKKNEDALISLK